MIFLKSETMVGQVMLSLCVPPPCDISNSGYHSEPSAHIIYVNSVNIKFWGETLGSKSDTDQMIWNATSGGRAPISVRWAAWGGCLAVRVLWRGTDRCSWRSPWRPEILKKIIVTEAIYVTILPLQAHLNTRPLTDEEAIAPQKAITKLLALLFFIILVLIN